METTNSPPPPISPHEELPNDIHQPPIPGSPPQSSVSSLPLPGSPPPVSLPSPPISGSPHVSSGSPPPSSVPSPTLPGSPHVSSLPSPPIPGSPPPAFLPSPTIAGSPPPASLPSPTITGSPPLVSLPPTFTGSPPPVQSPPVAGSPHVSPHPSPQNAGSPPMSPLPSPTFSGPPPQTSVPSPPLPTGHVDHHQQQPTNTTDSQPPEPSSPPPEAPPPPPLSPPPPSATEQPPENHPIPAEGEDIIESPNYTINPNPSSDHESPSLTQQLIPVADDPNLGPVVGSNLDDELSSLSPEKFQENPNPSPNLDQESPPLNQESVTVTHGSNLDHPVANPDYVKSPNLDDDDDTSRSAPENFQENPNTGHDMDQDSPLLKQESVPVADGSNMEPVANSDYVKSPNLDDELMSSAENFEENANFGHNMEPDSTPLNQESVTVAHGSNLDHLDDELMSSAENFQENANAGTNLGHESIGSLAVKLEANPSAEATQLPKEPPPSASPLVTVDSPSSHQDNTVANTDYLKSANMDEESTPLSPEKFQENPNHSPNLGHGSIRSSPAKLEASPSPILDDESTPFSPEKFQENPNARQNLGHESIRYSPVKLKANPCPESSQLPKDPSPSASPLVIVDSPSSPQDMDQDTVTPALPLGVPLLLHAAASSSPFIKPQISPWTPQETANLIQAYQEKWYSLKKGPLKAGQWEEVAITVAARCGYDEPTKTSKQCRHKLEKLRKRYRAERGKPRSKANGWNFFKLMDNLEKGPLPISSTPPMTLVEYQKPSSSNVNKRKVENDDEEDDDGGDREFRINKRSRSKNYNYHVPNGYLTRNLRFSDGGSRVVRGLRTPVVHKHKSFYKEDEEEEEEEEDEGQGGHNGGEEGVAAQLAVEIKGFAEKFVKMENKKIEMMRDVERYRLEMENKRMEMILESQQMLVETVNKAFHKAYKLSAS